MRTLARLATAVGIVLLALLATAGWAHAGDGRDPTAIPPSDPPDQIVVLSGDQTVIDADRTVDLVAVARGDVVVNGTVDGAVIVGNGTAIIRGEVTGDVVVFRGRAVVEDGATVGGNVFSSGRPLVGDRATVDGDVEKVQFTAIANAFGTAVFIFWWLAVTVSTLVAGLVFTGAFSAMARRTVDAGRDAVPASILAGAGATIALPLLSVALLFTLIASPLGLAGLAAMAPLYLVGYVCGALVLGHLILRDRVHLIGSFALGWLILRVVGLLPVFGGLLTFAATVFGLGALLVAAWRLTRPAPVEGPQASEPVLVPAGGGTGIESAGGAAVDRSDVPADTDRQRADEPDPADGDGDAHDAPDGGSSDAADSGSDSGGDGGGGGGDGGDGGGGGD